MNYRKLEAYRLAIRFLPIAARIIGSIPRGFGDLADQLRRASTSVPLNIAEGSGKTTARNRKRYYADARGSAMECAAIVDSCVAFEFIEEDLAKRAIELLTSEVRLLSKICL
jgi:four helix bundle protein